MAAKQEFASRFAKHKDELEWLFMELYHNREGLEVLDPTHRFAFLINGCVNNCIFTQQYW